MQDKQYRKTTQTGEKRTLVFGSKTCVDCENMNEMKTCKSAVKQEFGLKWRNVLLATCHSESSLIGLKFKKKKFLRRNDFRDSK